MSHNFISTMQIIDKIQNEAKNAPRSLIDKGLFVFMENIYKFSPAEDIANKDLSKIAKSTINFFDFIQNKPKNGYDIRIYHPNEKEYGYDSQKTYIEIVNNDMPFLIDSVTEEVKKHGITIHDLFHCVLEVDRDTEGNLTKVNNGLENRQSFESFIQLQVSKLSNIQVEKLEKSITNILSNVKIAVTDWKSILSEIDSVIAKVNSYASLQLNLNDNAQQNPNEVAEFLNWLKNNNFVFLGYGEYITNGNKFSLNDKTKLGIIKQSDPFESKNASFSHSSKDKNIINILKADSKSLIHRPVEMDYVSIKNLDENGQLISEYNFIGLFTSSVYYQTITNVPIVREKLKSIHKKSGFTDFGHRRKALVAILEDFPRDELLQSSEEELFEAAMGIVMLSTQPKIKLFLRKDEFKRYISCLVFVPRDIMDTDLRKKVESVLEYELNGKVVNHYTQINDSNMARIQIIVKINPNSEISYDKNLIEQKVAKAARLWTDGLKEFLNNKLGDDKTDILFDKYKNAFTVSYQNRFSVEDGYYDVLQSEKVLSSKQVVFDLYESTESTDEIFEFKIYTLNEQISLSRIMPILENMGLSTLDEHTYIASPKNGDGNKIWIHRFRFLVTNITKPSLNKIKNNFEDAIENVWLEKVDNDPLNKLILIANQKWRDVVMLRAYCKYMHQSEFTYGKEFVQSALVKNPRLVKLIIKLFDTKFNPDFIENRKNTEQNCLKEVEEILENVSNLAEDKVIRGILELISATKRTNFFQTDANNNFKEYVSFKFASTEISWIPEPKPYAEIFVYSARMEGVHLRGGKVARGGLRWSDRLEDFRTEVLGLVKAQMTKNSVIIPVGSKGGFVVKKAPTTGGREAFIAQGIECYKTFLRGLLDITDNMVENKISPPVNVVRHDGDDAYLVVAADKGTATFSDIANSISEEYNFWLGDAFASGGSAGYDHKKMGITAKGAWVSVKRHFSEMNLDVDKDDFTVIGIGDMGGDVFGNGMLCSKHIKLVGAFNHLHIFFDPSPDPLLSYKERERLFNLPRSSWLDYDEKLISQGGGVFERSAKSIELTPQMQDILGVKDTELSPDELIKEMLKAPVGLIWNGGIGTYVKAKSESHDDVGDKANDSLRINGEEVRADVIGEGGNLGFTQLGRIEYAQNGGRINTDAIDNSAGVDCSDHEVNIKIALEKAIVENDLKRDDRNDLLESMTDEVAELCLRDNIMQTQAITVAEQQGSSIIEVLGRKMSYLEKKGLLNREIEFLPSKEEIAIRHAEGKGLTRPEISVILAYSKIVLFEELVNSNLPDDEFYKEDLIRYFPVKLQDKYRKQIEDHPLRREIIATSVTNSILNRVGSALYYHIQENSGVASCDIARGYTIARELFEFRDLWDQVASTKNMQVAHQSEIFIKIQEIAERTTLWFLRHYPQPLQVKKAISDFQDGMKLLSSCLLDVMPKTLLKDYEKRVKQYKSYGLSETLSDKIARFIALSSACDIIYISREKKLSEEATGQLYFDLGSELNLGWIRNYIAKMPKGDYWETISHDSLIDETYDQQTRLTLSATNHFKGDVQSALIQWGKDNSKQLIRYNKFIRDLKSSEEADISMVIIALRKLREISAI